MNKPVYLGLPILDIIKITMYEYWYDYAKRKYGDIVKLCCMDMDSFIVQNELTILSWVLMMIWDYKCRIE